MRDEIGQYRELDVVPFGVNPASADEHAAYARRLRLPFVLLSDPGRDVARRYQALRPDGDEIVRTVYLIDRDGVIRYAQRGAPGASLILEPLRQGRT